MLDMDLEQFGSAANWEQLPEDIVAANFQETAQSSNFPGALLPAVAKNGRVFWYAIAGDAATWRRLRPLLLAYAGPTVTSFTGEPAILNSNRPPDRILQDANIFATAILVPPKNHSFAVKALQRLLGALEQRPIDISPPPISTATIISRFDMCLAEGDRAGAKEWLQMLRTEWRIDALNLLFAEVRLLYTFRDWSLLAAKEWFPTLCNARKPFPVARALMEALWNVHLASSAEDPKELKRRYYEDVRHLVLPLLEEVPADTADFAQLLHNIESLEPIPAPPRPSEGPKDWIAWLSAIEKEDYLGSLDAAREIAARHSVEEVQDPDAIRDLSNFLLNVGDGKARERLIAALPTFVQWVKDDDKYPRGRLRSVYDSLLTLFAFLDARGPAERAAIADLFDSLLTVGVSENQYRNLLEDVVGLIDEGAGTDSVYWLLDLADIILRHPAPDNGARLNLLNTALGSMSQTLELLSAGQRAAYARVAAAASWPPLPAETTPSPVDFGAQLAGKTIAVYTLTEAAARQARDALLDLAPDARIELSHDHVCSDRLQSLARQADLFVLATASAKHAATDCIQRYRKEGPLLYAAGRGFSSLVRAVEDHLLSQYAIGIS